MRIQQEFTRALDALIDQVKGDRSIVAAILCGSLSHDTVWAKSDIDLVLVTVDDKKLGSSDMLEPAGVGFFLSLGPAWRRNNELDAGANVEVVLHPDGLQIGDLSQDIIQAMKSAPEALKRFESLTSGYRKNMGDLVEEVSGRKVTLQDTRHLVEQR